MTGFRARDIHDTIGHSERCRVVADAITKSLYIMTRNHVLSSFLCSDRQFGLTSTAPLLAGLVRDQSLRPYVERARALALAANLLKRSAGDFSAAQNSAIVSGSSVIFRAPVRERALSYA
jgi:hypothetical protein